MGGIIRPGHNFPGNYIHDVRRERGGVASPAAAEGRQCSARDRHVASHEVRGRFTERERHARIILGTAETEIAEKFAQAAKQYESNPVAMHLRGMNMLFEGLKEKGSMIIVPSSALETMNLGAIGGMAAMSQVKSDKDRQESGDA